MQEVENLEDELQEEEPFDTDLEEKLAAPLELLRSVSDKLLRRDIEVSQGRLDGLFAHIQSAVGEVIDYAQNQFDASLEEMAGATETLAEEFEEHPEMMAEANEMMEDFEATQEFIQAGLGRLKETFFSASSFQDLEANQVHLADAEAQLEEGFARLESAILKADNPELFQISETASSDEVATALDSLAEAIEALNVHLEQGHPDQIQTALTHIDQARTVLERALTYYQEIEEEEEAYEDEEADDLEEEELESN